MSILILGASGGIGDALSKRFVAAEKTVFAHYHTNRPHGIPLKADLYSEEAVKQMFREIGYQTAFLDTMIYAAGIHDDHNIVDMTSAEWYNVLTLNLTGAFLCAKYALPVMRDGGRIVFLSSVVGQAGVPGCANYAASKAGLEGFARTLAREVAYRGITVNTVALGYTECGMIRDVPEKHLAEILGRTPIGRLVTGNEIYALVKYLIGPDSGAMTGQTISLNGGLYMG